MITQASLFERMPDPALATSSGATIVGAYRYHLWREWGDKMNRVCWVMLNPSTACATTDDPTIRRCLSFSKRWGFGALDVVNLFAFRATSPRDCMAAADPIGPENDGYLEAITSTCELVVCAWGTRGAFRERDLRALEHFSQTVAHKRLRCLGVTQDGHPKHPLYLAGATELQKFRGRGAA